MPSFGGSFALAACLVLSAARSPSILARKGSSAVTQAPDTASIRCPSSRRSTPQGIRVDVAETSAIRTRSLLPRGQPQPPGRTLQRRTEAPAPEMHSEAQTWAEARGVEQDDRIRPNRQPIPQGGRTPSCDSVDVRGIVPVRNASTQNVWPAGPQLGTRPRGLATPCVGCHKTLPTFA